jgi:hypothetical protein
MAANVLALGAQPCGRVAETVIPEYPDAISGHPPTYRQSSAGVDRGLD